MKDIKYLLIGGGMASFHAAKQIRKADPDGSVLIVGEEALPPYDRPPVSKEYLLGKKAGDEIVYESAEALAGQGIGLLLGTRIESLDLPASIAVTSAGEELRFEKALFATGGRPVRLSLP